MKKLALFLCAIVLVFIASSVDAQNQYTIIDLGTLGGNFSRAYDVNNNGQVVGEVDAASGSGLSFLWDRNNNMQNLGKIGSSNAAFGINDLGQVVGGGNPAYMWDSVNQMQDLNILYPNSKLELVEARDINDVGQIVGTATDVNAGFQSAFLLDDGGILNLGSLGGTHSQAYGINNTGQVVGWSYLENETMGVQHAFLWSNGTMTDLGTLGGDWSQAYAVSDSGLVVGLSEISHNGDVHAFLWENDVMTDLGSFDDNNSVARDINESGQVVGRSYWTPFLWEDGVMNPLVDLIADDSDWETLLEADAINDSGEIAGMGLIDGEKHAFLMTPLSNPIPIPSAIWLLGSAFIGLVGLRKKIRKGA